MSGIRSGIRLLASVAALVMFTGVAWPAAAQVCMLVMEQSEPQVMGSCCHHGSEERQPCHDEGSDEAPVPQHDAQLCCHSSGDAAFAEAVRGDTKGVSDVQPATRPAWSSELPAPPSHVGDGGSTDRAARTVTVPHLHLLYAVMLN